MKSWAGFPGWHREKTEPQPCSSRNGNVISQKSHALRHALHSQRAARWEGKSPWVATPSPYNWGCVPSAMHMNTVPFLLRKLRTWCIDAECDSSFPLSSPTLSLSRSHHTGQKDMHTETGLKFFKGLDWYMLLHGKLYIKLHLSEWIKKMWYIYTMEYYSAIKKNGLMPFAATRMQLEITILSEVSQKEKDKHHMISPICEI